MNISIDYKFKPFDMAPIIDTMNAYNTLYEKELQMYDTLALKLGDLSSAVQGTTLAKGIYDNYMSKLLSAVDNFTGGRDINTARELGVLRRMYGTDIRLLELARETMLANTKLLLLLHAADPSMIQLNVGNLDVYLNNPTYLPQGFSGDKLSDKTSKLILAMYRDVVSLGYDKEKLDLYHYKLVTLQGLDSKTASEAINAITNGQEIPNETLRNIAAQVFNLTGVASWGDPNAVTKTWDAIKNGISGGVGAVSIQAANDVRALAELQDEMAARLFARQERAARAREARARAAQLLQTAAMVQAINGIAPKPRTTSFNEVVNANNELYGKYSSSGYLTTTNGQISATKKAKEQYEAFLAACRKGGITNQQGMALANMSNQELSTWLNTNIKDKGKRGYLYNMFYELPSNIVTTPQTPAIVTTGNTSRSSNVASLKYYGDIPVPSTQKPISSKLIKPNLRTAGLYASDVVTLANNQSSPLLFEGHGGNQHFTYLPNNIGNLFSNPTKIHLVDAYTAIPKDLSLVMNNLMTQVTPGVKTVETVLYSGKGFTTTGKIDKNKLYSDYNILGLHQIPGSTDLIVEVISKKGEDHLYVRFPASSLKNEATTIMQNINVLSNAPIQTLDDANAAMQLLTGWNSDWYGVMSLISAGDNFKPQDFNYPGIPFNFNVPAGYQQTLQLQLDNDD